MGDSPAAVLYDSSGNEKGVAANPVQVGVIPNPTDVTGTITALNGVVAAAIQGWKSCAVVLTGTWGAVLVFEWSSDGGTTWTFGGFIAVQTGCVIPLITGHVAANGTYQTIGMGPTTHVRVRAAAFTSGTVNVRLVFSSAPAALTTSFSQIVQNVMTSTANSSTANLASGATFTGDSESSTGVAGIQVNLKSDQPLRVDIQQSNDGSNWDSTDIFDMPPNEGDGRTTQAVSGYFRVVVQNLGPATTTYFRLQTCLRPMVEALPRALTPSGALRLTTLTRGAVPDPSNFIDKSQHRALRLDDARNLVVRGQVLTDEQSYRDDFAIGAIYESLTGTCYFKSGLDHVQGVGTSFLSEVKIGQRLKAISDDDNYYAVVEDVLSDTDLLLEDAYAGSTVSEAGIKSWWDYHIGTGCAMTEASSERRLASGTTSGSEICLVRTGDYNPFVCGFRAKISNRIANQEASIGLQDGEYGSINAQACVVFSGTDNTKVKFRTSSLGTDIEETEVTIPNGGLSSAMHTYSVEATNTKCVLLIDGVRLKEHVLHIPGPYDLMDLRAVIHNTGVPSESVTLAIDVFFLANFNRLEIGVTQSSPMETFRFKSTIPTRANVPAQVADTVLLAFNMDRRGGTVYNDSSSILYLSLGSGASPTSFTCRLKSQSYYEIPFDYVGAVHGYWVAANGVARVTELT